MADKPMCYRCIHRGEVPGSAHSSCKHPALEKVKNNPLAEIASIFASVGRGHAVAIGMEKLNIKANSRGIQGGWFNFPFNFDPVWLENCDGYTPKEDKQNQNKEAS